MTTQVLIDDSTLTFAREALGDGQVVLCQWSAHGKVTKGTLRYTDCWKVELDDPVRPVAAGQTIVFYNPNDPDLVQGAAIVSR
jgi:tRNA U34 2-thiouridine synthase MnmA/TrmU